MRYAVEARNEKVGAMGVSDVAVMTRIRTAAEATIEQWPAARAVLLYGSRARGDHAPGSDWDVAVVTRVRKSPPEGLPIFDLGSYGVAVGFISERRIRAERNLLERVGCAMARQAKVWRAIGVRRRICGSRKRIGGAYWKNVHSSLAEMASGRWQIRSAMEGRVAFESQRDVERFLSNSSDCAEFVAKAVILRTHMEPQHTHDLGRMAGKFADDNPDLAEKILGLNGWTKSDHTLKYGVEDATAEMELQEREEDPVERVENGLRRLRNAMDLLVAEAPHWTGPDFARHLDKVREEAQRLERAQAVPLDDAKGRSGLMVAALRRGRGPIVEAAKSLLRAH